MIIEQECVPSTQMPHPHYHFLCSVDPENGMKSLIWHQNLKDYIIGNMLAKFQVDWNSTASKTTSTKTFNLKQDRRTEG